MVLGNCDYLTIETIIEDEMTKDSTHQLTDLPPFLIGMSLSQTLLVCLFMSLSTTDSVQHQNLFNRLHHNQCFCALMFFLLSLFNHL